MKSATEYNVFKLQQPLTIDGNWDKAPWKEVKPLEITNFMGKIPPSIPKTQAKMMYDSANLYLIFKVTEQYISCITKVINGPVWEDNCVEFFFAPDAETPLKYFNLEINCGGTPLMYYNTVPRKEFVIADPEDLKKIEIAHSLPRLIPEEIKDTVSWTIEYRLPLSLLVKYGKLTPPAKGVTWKANFYKIAEKSSNPHFITWSLVKRDEPDFHLPQFFGDLIFQ